ncbi:MAG: SWIM zinc finger family protein [Pyrobaculum sp.]|uniref:SWIM zinc finger family protein n=1 Tax=Pyrobaculum sp. TaxID=2004705 RepID=UPI0031636098
MREGLRRAIDLLRRDFPGKSYSWIRRALLRMPYVKEVREGLYVVEGVRELGDWKPLYQVWWSEREKRWYCTCYFSQFGWARQRGICTHVASVMLYRRYRRVVEKLEARRVYFASAEVECTRVVVKDAVEHKVKDASPAKSLLDYAKPRRLVVYAIAEREEVVIECDGRQIRVRGEALDYRVAKALLEEF